MRDLTHMSWNTNIGVTEFRDLPLPDNTTSADCQPTEDLTTVMIRHIPNDIKRDELLHHMAEQGLEGYYDFVYLPMDFRTHSNLGYAFVNFVSTDVADQCYYKFNGFTGWGWPSHKVTQIVWADCQGYDACIDRYRNSPVMHEDIADEFKPVLFKFGQRVPFPAPEKTLRKPGERMKKN